MSHSSCMPHILSLVVQPTAKSLDFIELVKMQQWKLIIILHGFACVIALHMCLLTSLAHSSISISGVIGKIPIGLFFIAACEVFTVIIIIIIIKKKKGSCNILTDY